MSPETAPPPRREGAIKYKDVAYDLTTLTRDELVALKVEVDHDLHGIRTQLEAARSQVRAHGVYSDPDWYRRAQSALRHYGTASQRIQLALRQHRQARDQERRRAPAAPRSFVELFYLVSREQLPTPLFEALKETAAARFAAATAEHGPAVSP